MGIGWTRGGPRHAAVLSVLVLGAAMAGCRPAAGPDADVRGHEDCPAQTPDGAPGSAFTVALAERVDPAHAPIPRNRSEALVFRLVYETLVDVACDGTVLPGLAERWSASEDHREWTFDLRRSAWYKHVDVPVRRTIDATAVVDAWRELRTRDTEAPWTWDLFALNDVEAVDGRRLLIRCGAPQPDLPQRLAGLEFAVATRRRTPEGEATLTWPQGTRGVLHDSDPSAAARDFLWWPESRDEDTPVARITFRAAPDADPRDLLDDETDLLLAETRATVDFVQGTPDFAEQPLPWDATYVLATMDSSVAAALTPAVREELATDVVRHLARPARAAATHTADGTSRPGGPRLLFLARDDAARSLVERLSVLLPGTERKPRVRLGAAYRPDGRDAGAVLRVSVTDRLERRYAALAREGAFVVPLVDCRASLLTRRDLSGVRIGYDGIPRLHRAGWVRGAQS